MSSTVHLCQMTQVKMSAWGMGNKKTRPDERPEREGGSNIQEALWQQVKALSAKDNNLVPTGLFIQALNEMIDNQGNRLNFPNRRRKAS